MARRYDVLLQPLHSKNLIPRVMNFKKQVQNATQRRYQIPLKLRFHPDSKIDSGHPEFIFGIGTL